MNDRHDSDRILDHTRQQLSALIDGELSPDEAAFLMRRLQHDQDLAGCWERWQLAGAVLRGEVGLRVPPAFSARVMDAVAREPVAMQARGSRRWLHWGGGAIAASVALVALLMSRPAGPPARQAEPVPVAQAPAPQAAPAPARPASPAPAVPDTAAPLASAVAVAEVPRRLANARRGGGQAQRAAVRVRSQDETPVVAVAIAPSAGATPVPSNPFSTRHAAIPNRPWPRAVVPGMPASGAFTVDYGREGSPSPSFFPFEPARLQPLAPSTPTLPADTP